MQTASLLILHYPDYFLPAPWQNVHVKWEWADLCTQWVKVWNTRGEQVGEGDDIIHFQQSSSLLLNLVFSISLLTVVFSCS